MCPACVVPRNPAANDPAGEDDTSSNSPPQNGTSHPFLPSQCHSQVLRSACEVNQDSASLCSWRNRSLGSIWASSVTKGVRCILRQDLMLWASKWIFFLPLPASCSLYSMEPSLCQGKTPGRTATHACLTGNHKSPPACLCTAAAHLCLLLLETEESDSIGLVGDTGRAGGIGVYRRVTGGEGHEGGVMRRIETHSSW